MNATLVMQFFELLYNFSNHRKSLIKSALGGFMDSMMNSTVKKDQINTLAFFFFFFSPEKINPASLRKWKESFPY